MDTLLYLYACYLVVNPGPCFVTAPPDRKGIEGNALEMLSPFFIFRRDSLTVFTE